MKNRIVLLVCVICIFSQLLFSQALSNKSSQREITIGMVGKISSNPVFIAAYSGARLAAKELGAKNKVVVTINWKTPEIENVQEQAIALDEFARSGVNGIAIACSDASFLTPILDKVIEKGTPVLCFDSDAPKSKRFVYYGADDAEFGKMLVEELAQELNGRGTIAVLAGNKNALNQQRRLQGVREELKKYPKIILSSENIYHHQEIPERAVETVTRAQQKNPNIHGWIFLGSWSLLVKNSITWDPGKIKVVAGNAVPAELEYVKSGHVQALVGVNCFQMGYKSVELLLEKILHNNTPEQEILFAPLTQVSKENVDEWSLNWKKWLLREAVNR